MLPDFSFSFSASCLIIYVVFKDFLKLLMNFLYMLYFSKTSFYNNPDVRDDLFSLLSFLKRNIKRMN